MLIKFIVIAIMYRDLKRNKIRTIHQDALVNLVDLRLLYVSSNINLANLNLFKYFNEF